MVQHIKIEKIYHFFAFLGEKKQRFPWNIWNLQKNQEWGQAKLYRPWNFIIWWFWINKHWFVPTPENDTTLIFLLVIFSSFNSSKIPKNINMATIVSKNGSIDALFLTYGQFRSKNYQNINICSYNLII